MDKIVSQDPNLIILGSASTSLLPLGFKDGETALIEKIFSPGLYLATFRDSVQAKVKGAVGLKIGTPVRVFRTSNVPSSEALDGNVVNAWLIESEAVLALTAFFPLAFGGKGGKARIEIYTPNGKEKLGKKKVVYFIITFTTERLGDLQWSIHLWGKNAEVQLYGGQKNKEEVIRELVQNVEQSLRKAGFCLTGTVNRLKEPFRIPQGFRLDWKV